MGNFCSGGEESKKASAFQTSDNSDALQVADHLSSSALSTTSDGGIDNNVHGLGSSSLQQDGGLNNNNSLLQQQQQQQSHAFSINNEAQLHAIREEQNRLDLIVQMAGRGMVSVRSTRGSTGYYDQGFAAALGQHLEQTTKFPDHLPIRLPRIADAAKSKSSSTSTSNNSHNKDHADKSPSSPSKSSSSSKTTTVFQRLSQPQWENIALGKSGAGLAGCDGENPNTYMDHVAVSFLDSVVPKKERIFHGGVGPMVENLL